MNTRPFRMRKKGVIILLTAILMLIMFAFLAFAVDIGYLNMVRTELQRTADATAIAATWSLLDEDIAANQSNLTYADGSTIDTATQFAKLNKVLNSAPCLLKVTLLSVTCPILSIPA